VHPLVRIAIATAPVWLARTAAADEFDVENFHAASPGDARLFGVESTEQAASGQLAVGMTLGLVDDPLVVVDRDDRVAAVVGDRFGADLAAAYGLGRIEARVALPLIVTQSGDVHMDTGLTGVRGGGTGDARVGARTRLLSAGRLTLAGDLAATLPTATRADYSGQSMPTASPTLIAAWHDDRVLVAANAGGRLRETRQLGDLDVGSAFVYGAGVSVAPLPRLAVIAELGGEVAGTRRNQTPLEVRGGLRWTQGNGLSAGAGYGRGLVDGYGAPDHRVLFTVTWQQERAAAPALPRVAAGAPPAAGPPVDPDPDRDGILAGADGCPTEAEDIDGFADADGCPDPDNDNDHIADAADHCPVHAEDVDGWNDDDGCPEPDNDFDGIADRDDRCPDQAEIINSVDDDDGCPDEGKRLVVIGDTRIEIREMIYFANDRAEILPRSRPVVEQLAKTLARNPWIKRVQVQGHTDDRAEDAYNKDLSQRRARSVVAALVELGIAGARLEAVGFGEEQPIDSNKTVEGRAHNRRVELHILDQDTPPPGWREQWSGGSR